MINPIVAASGTGAVAVANSLVVLVGADAARTVPVSVDTGVRMCVIMLCRGCSTKGESDGTEDEEGG